MSFKNSVGKDRQKLIWINWFFFKTFPNLLENTLEKLLKQVFYRILHGNKYKYICKFSVHLLLKCFGQQTNSTPVKRDIPQGRSIANDLSCRLRSVQATAAVAFHRSKDQQLLWLCMWSNKQFSGTNNASDWKGPSAK